MNGEQLVYLKLLMLSARPQMYAPSSPTLWLFFSRLCHEGHAHSRAYFLYPNRNLKGSVKKMPCTINRGPQSEPRKTGTLVSRASFTDQSPHRKESSGKKKKKKKVDIRHHWSTNFKRHFKPKLTSQKSILKNQTWIPMKYQSLDVYWLG